MKHFTLIICLIFSFSCNNHSVDLKPESYLSPEEIDQFKYDIIRYVDRLAKKASHATKFNTTFDDYYKSKSKDLDLQFYYKSKDTIYFAVTKIAPSIKLKKVATGGKIVKDKNGDIAYYEETFRTYKMEVPILLEKTELIFQDLIKGKDITKYEFKNTNPEEFIEFPDENTFYDSKERIWISKLENPYEELKKSLRNEN